MTGALAVELAKPLYVLERDRRFAEALVFFVDGFDVCQVKDGVSEHRCVTDRQHEPVAVWPDRIIRIKPQEALPQAVGHGGQRHRCAGVP